VIPSIESLLSAADLIRRAQNVVVLTGAGISTPSGIPDFRSHKTGMWDHVDPNEVASIYAFRHHPEAFFEWVRPLTRQILQAQPNPAHIALAQLEEQGIVRALITQNIDMLHTRAGSRTIYEVHGHLREATCVECFRIFPFESFITPFVETGAMPRCLICNGVLKPNVILFGEALPIRIITAAQKAARECDVLIVVGSSLEVAPASELPQIALAHGAKLILINYDETFIDDQADVVLHDDVAQVLPRLVQMIKTTSEKRDVRRL
jgi:NAD-dependent deacetylase